MKRKSTNRASNARILRNSLLNFMNKLNMVDNLFKRLKVGSKHEMVVDFDVGFSKRRYLANYTIYIGKWPRARSGKLSIYQTSESVCERVCQLVSCSISFLLLWLVQDIRKCLKSWYIPLYNVDELLATFLWRFFANISEAISAIRGKFTFFFQNHGIPAFFLGHHWNKKRQDSNQDLYESLGFKLGRSFRSRLKLILLFVIILPFFAISNIHLVLNFQVWEKATNDKT